MTQIKKYTGLLKRFYKSRTESIIEVIKRSVPEYKYDEKLQLLEGYELIDELLNIYGDKYIIADNLLFEIINKRELNQESYVVLSDNNDTTYTFTASFYDNDTNLQEVLTEVIDTYGS